MAASSSIRSRRNGGCHQQQQHQLTAKSRSHDCRKARLGTGQHQIRYATTFINFDAAAITVGSGDGRTRAPAASAEAA